MMNDLTTRGYTYTDGMGASRRRGRDGDRPASGRAATRYAHNAHALVTSIVAAEGTAEETLSEFEYDAADNLTAAIDLLPRRTEYAYDALRLIPYGPTRTWAPARWHRPSGATSMMPGATSASSPTPWAT